MPLGLATASRAWFVPCLWPAAQALAEDLIEFWRAEPAAPEAAATFVEVAAGAGLVAGERAGGRRGVGNA